MSDEEDLYIPLYKIIIIGDTGVGKTCILKRFVDGIFINDALPTIGVEFLLKEVIVDSVRYKLQIWDTAGQEIFKSITQSYFRSADGAIVVFDILTESSFNDVPKWIDEFYEKTGLKNIVIVGNKADCEEKRQVQAETAKKFTEEREFGYYETSALTGLNIEDAFNYLVRIISTASSHKSSPQKGVLNNENLDSGKKCC